MNPYDQLEELRRAPPPGPITVEGLPHPVLIKSDRWRFARQWEIWRPYGSIFYRAGLDNDGNVAFVEYERLRETPLGCWIAPQYPGKKRLVLYSAKQKFAYLTKQEALVGAIQQTKNWLRFIRRDFEFANFKLNQLEHALEEINDE